MTAKTKEEKSMKAKTKEEESMKKNTEDKTMNRSFEEETNCCVCGKKDRYHFGCMLCGNPCCLSTCTKFNFDHEKASKFEFIEGFICKKCHPNMLRKFPPNSWVRKVIELYKLRYDQGYYDGQTDGLSKGWLIAHDQSNRDEWIEEGLELPCDISEDDYDRFRNLTRPIG